MNIVKIQANHHASSFLGRVPTPDENFYSFRRCDDEEKDKMRGKYIQVLKNSSLIGLCNKYAVLCKKENVDVQC